MIVISCADNPIHSFQLGREIKHAAYYLYEKMLMTFFHKHKLMHTGVICPWIHLFAFSLVHVFVQCKCTLVHYYLQSWTEGVHDKFGMGWLMHSGVTCSKINLSVVSCFDFCFQKSFQSWNETCSSYLTQKLSVHDILSMTVDSCSLKLSALVEYEIFMHCYKELLQ